MHIPFSGRIRKRLFGSPLSKSRAELLQQMPKGSVCAEVGVYKGDFSEHILRTVRPSKLHLIDPWHYETSTAYSRTWYGGKIGVSQGHMDAMYRAVLSKFRREIAAGIVVVHRASSADVLPAFPLEYFDWLYIDGNHSYDFVRADLELGMRVLKPGGFLAGDDYHDKGWWEDGVIRAVDEMRETCRTRMIWDGQFILQKPAAGTRITPVLRTCARRMSPAESTNPEAL